MRRETSEKQQHRVSRGDVAVRGKLHFVEGRGNGRAEGAR
jgi:hypothetical protein